MPLTEGQSNDAHQLSAVIGSFAVMALDKRRGWGMGWVRDIEGELITISSMTFGDWLWRCFVNSQMGISNLH